MSHACTRHTPSTTCYSQCACRCDQCRAAKSSYDRARRAGLLGSLAHHAPDLSEIAWLLEMGEAPQIIATRMNSTVGAIARRARRLGHVDTARQFEREVRAERAEAA